ncbi:MAG: hypothetical protein IJ111_01195 [Eggerthellaceae bacterium]|nr:hypothetical protein [Eggerthellaceae bacterium]
MAEGDELWQITGGNVSLGAFTDLKASGSIDYKGATVPDGGNLIRVYYSFSDESGESVTRPICTCFVDLGDDTHTGSFVEGSAELRSVLAVLADDGPGKPYVAAAGANPVSLAADIAKSLGLRVNVTPSSYRLAGSHICDPDETWLGVVNWLLAAAGYSSVYPDAMGTVQMHPYVEPTKRSPSWWFRDDGESAMKVSVTHSDNKSGIPNAVNLWYEDETCGIAAKAVNTDDRSSASTVVLGRTISMRVEVDEIAGNSVSEKLANLKQEAKKQLIDNSTLIEKLEIPCMYVPIEPNDCVGVEWEEAGIDFIGGCTAMDITCALGAATVVKIRNLLPPDFEVTVSGEVSWSV